ncbi:MAG: substrate-binding domain-containing protein [Lentisphaeria bacterium]|nr:substrate-binding domain-containing protein [Lentisphaeria bacterium]
MKKEELVRLFEFYLSQPPCMSGVRLRSEPELGRIFNENRQKIRRALDELVERGFLTRKHGSGTFVRKVFPAAEAPEYDAVAHLTRILPEQIFLPEPQEPQTRRPDRSAQGLRIGIPGDIRFLTRTNYTLFEAARVHLESLGHTAVLFSQYSEGLEVFKTAEALAEEFRRNRCDGYLFESYWNDTVQAALRLAFGAVEIPAIYFWPGSTPVNCEPLIQIDTDEAVRRAADLLAGFGYRRIALVNMEDNSHSAAPERAAFQQRLAFHRLDYQEVITLRGPLGAGLAVSLDALFERNAPDALYVADDHYIPGLCRWLGKNGIEPGRDLGVITLANRSGELNGASEWSRLEFDPAQVGFLAADHLVRAIHSPGAELCNFSHQATWKPGISTREQKNEA